MNVFVPYSSPLDCAKAMWGDRLRYNKQIIEIKQIIAAIEVAKAWRNHPVCLMYKEHKEWLYCYMKVFECYREFKKHNRNYEEQSYYFLELDKYNMLANELTPSFIDDAICIQHRRRLYTKSPDKYPQFAQYGTSDINYYVVNGELLKYKDGKRI